MQLMGSDLVILEGVNIDERIVINPTADLYDGLSVTLTTD